MKIEINHDIILASKSPSRAALLFAAGFENLRIMPSGVDEAAIKKNFSGKTENLALELASSKALKISAQHPEGWVIGADQILSLDDKIFDKPGNRDQAEKLLKTLRGRQHQLIGGHVLARENKILWHHLSHVQLTMRDFSDAWLDLYLSAMGEKLLKSAGAYQLEGPAVHLFSEIHGNYFATLGLDLLPLLRALRKHGAILS